MPDVSQNQETTAMPNVIQPQQATVPTVNHTQQATTLPAQQTAITQMKKNQQQSHSIHKLENKLHPNANSDQHKCFLVEGHKPKAPDKQKMD